MDSLAQIRELSLISTDWFVDLETVFDQEVEIDTQSSEPDDCDCLLCELFVDMCRNRGLV